jgi:hypothetical protein
MCLRLTLVGEWLVVYGEEFRQKGSPAPTKFKVAVCWSSHPDAFWDFKGLAHLEIMPTGTNVNSERYCEMLRKVKTRLGRVRPYMEQPLIELDDARQHTKARSAAEIRRLASTVLDHPPYRAILAPSGFHFFFPNWRNVWETVTVVVMGRWRQGNC